MTFKYYLNSYKKQNDTYSIRLKLSTGKNDVQYIDSKISVFDYQWDSKKQKIKRHLLEEGLNARLFELVNNVQKIYNKNEMVSASRLLKLYKNRNNFDSRSFVSFYQKLIDEMISKDKLRTAKTNQAYLNKLCQYQSKIPFNDLSIDFAQDYEKWLIKKGNQRNTIASNFKSIKATLNKAVKFRIIEFNPFNGFSVSSINSEKDSLTIDEIKKLENMHIKPHFIGMLRSRDMFLFSFYSAGMRFSDVCRLKWSNIVGSDIVYTMNKSRERSGGKRVIPLNQKSKDIINKYKGNDETFVFPPLYKCSNFSHEKMEYKLFISNNKINKSLRIVGVRMGLNFNLTMHIAKHTFADYAVKNGVSVLILSKLLGHTNLSTTQHYLKDFYNKEQSDTLNDLFK